MDVPYTQTVDPARYVGGAVSIGTTSTGSLNNPVQLPLAGDNHYVLDEHLDRDTHWGTDELVRILTEAAAVVHERHGARTGIGNMSAPRGGDIRWSRSHNNGRDADVAFYVVDANDDHVEVPTLYTALADGSIRRREGLRFDVERGWTFVEAMLSSTIVQVQWIFLYDPLKQELLAHARSIGADPRIIALASDIVHQPGDSAPHDDHFHIRIFCTRSDRLEGCENWGPEWEHANLYADAVGARVDELLRGLADPSEERARECLDRLHELNGEAIAHELARSLPHVSPSIQLAIMDRLAEFDVPGVSGPLIALLESSPDAAVRTQAAWLLGYLADPTSARGLAALVATDGDSLGSGDSLRRSAAHALRNVFAPEGVEDLIAGAGDLDPLTRATVSNVLARATGFLSADIAPTADQSTAFWTDWWTAHSGTTQGQWYFEAFEGLGYAGTATTWESVSNAQFLRALSDDRPHVRFIADRTLKSRTGTWTPSEGWSTVERERFWRRQLGS
ncbi:MAG: penicillin-insensitive murein endopeptidase [Bradymonadia bacterium]|jgi:penicillin-insensitive murein endopeptidase